MDLIQHWGYWLMLGAALVEGETFLVLGGMAIAAGLMSFYIAWPLVIVGCMIHDCFCFYLGRYAGTWVMRKRAKWRLKARKFKHLITKFDIWIILGFRFAYGVRTIVPFLVGMGKTKNLKFLPLALIGAIVWSACFLILGYFSGHGLLALKHYFSLKEVFYQYWYISYPLIGLFAFGLVLLITHFFRRFQRNKRNKKIKV